MLLVLLGWEQEPNPPRKDEHLDCSVVAGSLTATRSEKAFVLHRLEAGSICRCVCARARVCMYAVLYVQVQAQVQTQVQSQSQ